MKETLSSHHLAGKDIVFGRKLFQNYIASYFHISHSQRFFNETLPKTLLYNESEVSLSQHKQEQTHKKESNDERICTSLGSICNIGFILSSDAICHMCHWGLLFPWSDTMLRVRMPMKRVVDGIITQGNPIEFDLVSECVHA